MKLVFLIFFQTLLSQNKETFVLVHGAFGSISSLKALSTELQKNGHESYLVSLSGLGDKYHLANKDIDLDTHISDIVNLIEFGDLKNVTLIVHSYAGMLARSAAAKIPKRIKHIVYLDAYLPDSNEAVIDLINENKKAWLFSLVKDGMVVPPWSNDSMPAPRDVPHPFQTFMQRTTFSENEKTSSTYLLFVEKGKEVKEDDFYTFYKRAKSLKYKTAILEGPHNLQRKKPKYVSDKILELLEN